MNSSQVDCQVVALCNWFVTQCKTERLSAGVNSLIPVPIIRFVSLSKWLATHCSTVWLFHSHIQFNKEALCKQFVTTCATIRLQYKNIDGGKPAGIYVQKICHTLSNYMVFLLCELSYADQLCCYTQTICHTMCNWKVFHLHELCICRLRLSLRANNLPHSVQLYCFSTVLTFLCWLRTLLCS
jgi:hypothetical protein